MPEARTVRRRRSAGVLALLAALALGCGTTRPSIEEVRQRIAPSVESTLQSLPEDIRPEVLECFATGLRDADISNSDLRLLIDNISEPDPDISDEDLVRFNALTEEVGRTCGERQRRIDGAAD